ncbi:hypothetical protein [Metapseudomonas resinovorans]|uniref:hypothetical protein n=1 Tax=Metapseudomonas resinovorans TaxID=53412 RepID=UPI0012DDCA5F|nr:hypothetical protein [Pseudomonas resinovorans]MDE3735852.1 hypothetical protein [Pseudomonas resinovorans]
MPAVQLSKHLEVSNLIANEKQAITLKARHYAAFTPHQKKAPKPCRTVFASHKNAPASSIERYQCELQSASYICRQKQNTALDRYPSGKKKSSPDYPRQKLARLLDRYQGGRQAGK